jgi:hypothetical protein
MEFLIGVLVGYLLFAISLGLMLTGGLNAKSAKKHKKM